MYIRFAGMIITSTVIMYGLMYMTAYRWDHVFFSETRLYMALVMGATMAVIMLSFMLNMLSKRMANLGVYVASVALFILALWLARSQRTINDVDWMEAMIPHHSIAILVSERANITDPRVQDLANQIIESQRQEIAEMKKLIRELTGEAPLAGGSRSGERSPS